jgi:uncharacterized protein (DUF427 family)
VIFDPQALERRIAQARTVVRERPPAAEIVVPQPGEESVWDYPRPPRVVESAEHVLVGHQDTILGESRRSLRVLETAGAPTYYLPPEDCAETLLVRTPRWWLCEWKGVSFAYDLVLEGERIAEVAWSYPEPLNDLGMGYDRLRGYLAFYPQKVDLCFVDRERVVPQPGGYYGGWITPRIVGPFKGSPGSERW